jgi:hypothetical protein
VDCLLYQKDEIYDKQKDENHYKKKFESEIELEVESANLRHFTCFIGLDQQI